MSDFLRQMAEKLVQTDTPLSDYIVISPTRRASNKLKSELAGLLNKDSWLPEFLTINQWTERLSGLQPADNLELKFACYEAYVNVLQSQAQGISDFFSWSDILIRDFNDIESQLIETKPFFKELTDYTEIEHFSFLTSPLTEKQERYRSFWNAIPKIHAQFNQFLLNQGLGYSGLILRTALKKVKDEDYKMKNRLLVVGFNAFSKAESELLKVYQAHGQAQVYYDTDDYYLNQPENHAGVFIRRNLKNNLGEPLPTPRSLAERPLNIELCAAAHRVDQAQVVAGLLEELTADELKKTVLVLADESLLIPVLDKLPNSIEQPNITMGISVSDSTFTSWLDSLYEVLTHRLEDKKKFKFSVEKVHSFFSHPFSQFLAPETDFKMAEMNGFMEQEELRELKFINEENWIEIVLNFWTSTGANRGEELNALLTAIAEKAKSNKISTIAILQAEKAIALLQRGLIQLGKFSEEKLLSNQVHHQLLMRMVAGGSIDLVGEATDKLQIMGILETRALAFDRVIICGVNEDTLPKKPSLESFVPFEIRNHHLLPGKKEKEAVYAYNFYRLIQHAANVQLIYHTDKSHFSGGEKSRYIHQIEYDLKRLNPNLKVVNRNLFHPPIASEALKTEIVKTPEIIEKIKDHFKRGLSISSINRYLDDPLDWYYNYVLRFREPDTGEIDVATFGNIVHEVLEDLYKPVLNKVLTLSDMQLMQSRVEDTLSQTIGKYVLGKKLENGINRIHLETSKLLIHNYLKSESELLSKGETITCIDVEKRLERTLVIHSEGEEIAVLFKGSADKVQRRNGVLEILDYKTGNVDARAVKIKDFSIEEMAKVPKSVQLMTYNWMASEVFEDAKINSRIIALPTPYNRKLEILFERNDKEVVTEFEAFLREIILEMLNAEIVIEKNTEFLYATYE